MTEAFKRLELDCEAALCPKRGTPKPLAIVRGLDLRAVLDERAELIAALNSAGEWIQQAEIAVEPGWAGSQQHILNEISALLARTEAVTDA